MTPTWSVACWPDSRAGVSAEVPPTGDDGSLMPNHEPSPDAMKLGSCRSSRASLLVEATVLRVSPNYHMVARWHRDHRGLIQGTKPVSELTGFTLLPLVHTAGAVPVAVNTIPVASDAAPTLVKSSPAW